MGFFEAVSGTTHPVKYIESLPEPDGYTHIMIVKIFGRYATSDVSGVDNKASKTLDVIVTFLQQKGRKLVDVKLSSINYAGISNDTIAYHLLISYI